MSVKREQIPIGQLEAVKAQLREQGVTFRIRYRGPRVHTIGKLMPQGYRRGRVHAQQDCLKEDATHFVVYKNR